MREFAEPTLDAFTSWLLAAPRPHTATLDGSVLIIDDLWQADLRQHGALLQDAWLANGEARLLWTPEGVVVDLIRISKVPGWEWVRSATTAWRILHSSKGPEMPPSVRTALSAVLEDPGAARFALETTRLEAVLAASTAQGIRVDTAALEAKRVELLHTHRLLKELFGFDPLARENDGQTRAWLARKGVHVDGVTSEDWGSRVVDDSPVSRESETVYEHALHLRRRLPKVLELAARTNRGKVRSKLIPAAQVSGRISSTCPALNNVAADLRHLLVARTGHVFISADFDGIEPRVLAALSGDIQLIRDLDTGDPYADAAHRAGYDPRRFRTLFKVIMISTMYGAQPSRTARQLGVSLAEAKRVRSLLWMPYQTAEAWLRTQEGFGPLRLDSGRPLGVVERAHARPNLIIQSTAYDLFQAAALRVHEHLPAGCHIVLPMHDELVIEAPDHARAAVLDVLAAQMPARLRGVDIGATPAVLGAFWWKP